MFCVAEALSRQARSGGSPETPLHHLGAADPRPGEHPLQSMHPPSCHGAVALSTPALVCFHVLYLFLPQHVDRLT